MMQCFMKKSKKNKQTNKQTEAKKTKQKSKNKPKKYVVNRDGIHSPLHHLFASLGSRIPILWQFFPVRIALHLQPSTMQLKEGLRRSCQNEEFPEIRRPIDRTRSLQRLLPPPCLVVSVRNNIR